MPCASSKMVKHPMDLCFCCLFHVCTMCLAGHRDISLENLLLKDGSIRCGRGGRVSTPKFCHMVPKPEALVEDDFPKFQGCIFR